MGEHENRYLEAMTKETMEPDMQIQFGNVPRELFNDFEKSLDKSISLEIKKDANDNFDSSDIVIYIKDHLAQIIVEGTRDLLVLGVLAAIKSLWTEITKRKKSENIQLNIEIKPDIDIEYSLTGNINPKIIGVLTDKIFKNLTRGKSLKSKSIKMVANSKLKKWEKEDLTKLKKKDKKLLEKLLRNVRH